MINAIKDRKPSVVSFRKPNSLMDHAAWLYMLLLISGAWPSEQEMLADKGTDYQKAIASHGIIVPDDDVTWIFGIMQKSSSDMRSVAPSW
jgi:hypothetical protein